MWNKKSQMIILKLMLGIILFIVAMILVQPVKENIDNVTNATNLNCSSSSLSTTQVATCVTVEMTLFYFISVLIALSIAVVSGSRTFQGIITTIVIFVVTVVLITPLKNFIVYFRDASHLDCTNASISTAAKMTCLVVDVWLFYFIVIVIATAVTLIFREKLMPKIIGENK